MIEGVKVKNLRVIPDERGRLMEMIRCDDPEFIKFGQVYMTTAYPGVVKAWHYHKKQVDNFVVVKGMVKLVLYDQREESATFGETNEFFMGDRNPIMVQIPALVLHGFKAYGDSEAIIVNLVTELYNYSDPDEYRIPPHSVEVPYDWALQER